MNDNDSFLLLALFYANHKKKQSNSDDDSIDLQQHPTPIVQAIAKLSEELDDARRHAGYYKHPDGFAMREIRKAETLAITGLYLGGDAEDPLLIADPVRVRLEAVYKMGLDMDLFDRDMIKQRFVQLFPDIYSDVMEDMSTEQKQFMEETRTMYAEDNYLSILMELFDHVSEVLVSIQLMEEQGLGLTGME